MSNKAALIHRPRWTEWSLDAETIELVHSAYGYRVDLEDCLTSAQTLDWAVQIALKGWDATGLLCAIDDIFVNLQGHLCPSGRSKRVTKSFVKRKVGRFVE